METFSFNLLCLASLSSLRNSFALLYKIYSGKQQYRPLYEPTYTTVITAVPNNTLLYIHTMVTLYTHTDHNAHTHTHTQ